MKTYPVIIRFADGTETSAVYDTYCPGQTDAVNQAKQDPQAVEIVEQAFKNGALRGGAIWKRETSGYLTGKWFSREIEA